MDAESVLPQKFIVNSAFKAEKKSYPIRWIIVLVSTFSALLLAIIIIILIENFAKIKKKSLSTNLWSLGNLRIFDREKQPPGQEEEEKVKKVVHEEKAPEPVIVPEPAKEKEPEEIKEEEKPRPVQTTETKTKEENNSSESSKEQFYNTSEMKTYYDNSSIAGIILKWWVHIVVIAIVAILLGILFSSPIFITPKYKSYAIAYPHNIAPYSDESETEQMLQLLQSKDITDSVIKKFDLAKHYKVDSNFKYFYSTIYYEFGQNVSITKTPFESVNITVLDSDPLMANNIVNAILYFYNLKVRNTHNLKYLEVIRMYEAIIDKKQAHIDSLKHQLYILSTEYGLIDYDAQALEITKGYLRTVMGASSTSINQREVMRLKKNIEEHGGDLIELVESIKNETQNFSMLKVDYENAVRFYTDELSYANVITHPYPADKKSYPVRWLIVVFTLIATIFLTIIIILIIERYRYYFRLKK